MSKNIQERDHELRELKEMKEKIEKEIKKIPEGVNQERTDKERLLEKVRKKIAKLEK